MHVGHTHLTAFVLIMHILCWSQGQVTLPSKDYCEYQGQIIPPGLKKIALKADPCIRCRCVKGELECRNKICPELKCEELVRKPNKCCPKCVSPLLSKEQGTTKLLNDVAVRMGLDITSDGINQVVTLRLPPPPMIPPPPPSVLATELGNSTETPPIVITTTETIPVEATIIPHQVTRMTRAPPTPPPTPPPPGPDMNKTRTTPSPEPTSKATTRPKPNDAWKMSCSKFKPGEQGVKVEVGALGTLGMQGPRVTVHPTDPPSVTGNPGESGLRWLKGEPGVPGNRGPVGPQGPMGPKGSFGLPGPRGQRGPRGKAGKRGRKGDVGEPGPTGPEGLQGLPGNVSLPGPIGPPGQDGQMGQVGPIGPAGPAGQAGSPGRPGPQGPKGERGDTSSRLMEGQLIIVANEIAMHSIRAEAALVYRMDDKKLYFRDTEQWNCLMTEGSMKVIAGPPGSPGPQGDMGPPGPQGPKGDKGDLGDYNSGDQEVCGNDLIEGKEQCDDGNDIDTDSCIYCRRSYCGDGYRQEGVEECDTFNFNGKSCDDYFSEYETMGMLRCTDRCRIDTGDCKVVRRRKRQLPPE